MKRSLLSIIIFPALFAGYDILEIRQKSHYVVNGTPLKSNVETVEISRSTCDECDMDTIQLIRYNGYNAERHTVITEDGYILVLHRIPGKIQGEYYEGGSSRCPVLLQHGLLGSSSDWVMQPPHRSLAYLLSDYGYDVWLGNARGNTYSRRHVKLNVKQAKFWRFSWDEMGRYDMPAVIDYILNTTNSRQICYVGHSMGTTMFWVMMHYHPKYNDKIRVMQALAPIAKVSHMKSPIRVIAPFANDIHKISEFFGLRDFLPNNAWVKLLAKYFCKASVPTRYLCTNVIFLLAGYDSVQLNSTTLPVILSHTPAGTSTQTVVHFAQQVNSDAFLQFDWGRKENLDRYGQATPPKYNLSRVNCPVQLYRADNDILADSTDVQWLASQLPNLNDTYLVPFKRFNHIDFVWAEDADMILYGELLKTLNSFSIF